MNLGDIGRFATRAADATTATAGALGGAAVNGAVGAVKGTATGVRNGFASGSHSTPTAVLTLAAIGAAGVVEWPLLVAVGGTALVVRQLGHRSDGEQARPRPTTSTSPGRRTNATKTAPRKGAKTARSTRA